MGFFPKLNDLVNQAPLHLLINFRLPIKKGLAMKVKTTHIRSLILLFLVVSILSSCMPHKERESLWDDYKKDKQLSENRNGPQDDMARRNEYCDELLLRYGIDGTSKEGEETSKRCKSPSFQQKPFPTDRFSIALSGGGARSGSFSMGVLKALQKLNYLAQLDAISSVSGGGFAAYWYIMQRYYQYIPEKYEPERQSYYADVLYQWNETGNDPINHPLCDKIKNGVDHHHSVDDIFKSRMDGSVIDPTLFQSHIEQQSDIINYFTNTPLQKVETSAAVLTHLISLPFYWVTDGIFQTGLFNGSVITLKYRQGLERTYGLVPDTNFSPFKDYFDHDPAQFHNGRIGSVTFWLKNVQAKELEFKDLRAFNQAHNRCVVELRRRGDDTIPALSLPIINANVKRPATLFKDVDFETRLNFDKSVFTFSPLTWGSYYKGYLDDHCYEGKENCLKTPILVSKAYAISGAALDSAARESKWYIDTILESLNFNLGYDIRNPAYRDEFDNFWYYSHKLLGGFPLGFFIPEKKKPILHLSDGGHAENLGAYSLIKRGTRRIVIVDAEHDPNYEFESLQRLINNLKTDLKLTLQCKKGENCPMAATFSADRAEHAVFPMEVIGFLDKNGIAQPIDILYVKLSFDKKKLSDPKKPESKCIRGLNEIKVILDKNKKVNMDNKKTIFYPCHVAEYYQNEAGRRKNPFPQNGTFDMWYQEKQYRAFRDLGYFIGMTELNKMIEEENWIEKTADGRKEEAKFMKKLLAP